MLTSSSQKQIYSDMLDYIKLNYCNNLRVSDIALHFGYNENICRIFQAALRYATKAIYLEVKN